MSITPITDTPALTAFCDSVAGGGFITVDTEFMREKTYWPQLCLIQVAGPDGRGAVIDPLADGLDLSPFYALLKQPDLVKVFHACRQDVEIFVREADCIPAPLFDTQVAAMVLGYGDQVGYANLVQQVLDHRLDKSQQFTNWAARPLNPSQLVYALADVTHLRDLYVRFKAELDKLGRTDWIAEEMQAQLDPANFSNDPQQAWRRIKSRNTNPRFLKVVRAVAAWREEQAQRRDIPKNRLLREEALLAVCAATPRTVAELGRIRGVGSGFAEGRMGKPLLACVAEALKSPDTEAPRLPKKTVLSENAKSVADLLKVLLKLECAKHRLAPRLVASATDIEKLAAENRPDVPALQGWRHDIFGQKALALKAGRLALHVQKGRVCVGETGEAPASPAP